MSTVINLRVPDDVLARIHAEAERLGVNRTALLLRPWSGDGRAGDPAPSSRGPATPKRQRALEPTGVHYGPIPTKPGARLKTK